MTLPLWDLNWNKNIYCYQILNFSKFFCWLCTFVFLNTLGLACVFFTLLPVIKHIKDHQQL